MRDAARAKPAILIIRLSHLQLLQCAICESIHQYGRSTAMNPEAMALLVERVTDDHQECIQWAADPDRAKRERGVKVRMRREFEKLRCHRRLF